ncbi:MAG: epoxyqueuosine reductase [Firmicutes bacterium]|nr:epoxyqueuosine reductase [Bacillota bacterium]
MRETITRFIMDAVAEKDKEGIITDIWRTPIVRFGNAELPEYDDLKRIIHPDHGTPKEILPTAKTVIAYFLPLRKEIGDTNKGDRLSSADWAKAYEKTNAFFYEFNDTLVAWLKEQGYDAAVSPEAGSYDDKLLLSKWSQRHIAYYCGLGTFGINNMLITEAGCCGRVSTVVTSLQVTHDYPVSEQYCLYKKDGSCGACVKHCPVGALSFEGYDRYKCNSLCDENAAVHVGYCETPSYSLSSDTELIGSNTCGKCVTVMPCTYGIPGKK